MKRYTTITIHREQIAPPVGCEEAVELWEPILGGADSWTGEWTPLHAAWLAVADGAGPCLMALGWLEGHGTVPCVLRSANLRCANLSYADLRDAYLSRADLRGANLSCADLHDANLRGADLRYADLSGAVLSGADLSGADLRDAYLSRADLRDAYLSGANLSRADLSGADLRGAWRYSNPPSGWRIVDGRLRNAKKP